MRYFRTVSRQASIKPAKIINAAPKNDWLSGQDAVVYKIQVMERAADVTADESHPSPLNLYQRVDDDEVLQMRWNRQPPTITSMEFVAPPLHIPVDDLFPKIPNVNVEAVYQNYLKQHSSENMTCTSEVSSEKEMETPQMAFDRLTQQEWKEWCQVHVVETCSLDDAVEKVLEMLQKYQTPEFIEIGLTMLLPHFTGQLGPEIVSHGYCRMVIECIVASYKRRNISIEDFRQKVRKLKQQHNSNKGMNALIRLLMERFVAHKR